RARAAGEGSQREAPPSANLARRATGQVDRLMTTNGGGMKPSRRSVIARVSDGFAAENPPLKPVPQAHSADTTVGMTLVMMVESPTYSTRASACRSASASFADAVCGFEIAT